MVCMSWEKGYLKLTSPLNERLERLKNSTKGDYITQGVSFNKKCERQMNLLLLAFNDSTSFSGLVKEMLALRYEQSKNSSSSFSKDIVNITDNKLNNIYEKVESKVESKSITNNLFKDKERLEKTWL